MSDDREIARILVERGVVTETQRDAAFAAQLEIARRGRVVRIVEVFVEQGHATPEAIQVGLGLDETVAGPGPDQTAIHEPEAHRGSTKSGGNEPPRARESWRVARRRGKGPD